MTEKTYVPGVGRTVPLEDGTPWPKAEDGAPVPLAVPDTRYFRRLIADFDIVEPTPSVARRQLTPPAA